MSNKNINVSARSPLNEIMESITGFWQWWIEELAGMTPQVLRNQFKMQSKALLVEIDNGACRLKTTTANGLAPLTEFSLGNTPTAEDLGQRKQLAGMSDKIVLLLPNHYILRKIISLPEATANKLADVLTFEMDRNTPFKAEDVYFSYQILGRDSAQQKIQVELSVVTRTLLDELLARLGAQGVKPSRVVPADMSPADLDNSELNLISQQGPLNQRDTTKWQRQQKLGVLLVLILLIAFGGLYQRYQQVETLTQEIVEPRALAMQAKKLREELQQLKERRHFLINKKAADTSTLMLLSELTTMLPDNTWLTRMSVKQGTVTLQGESTNASALIALIEASEMFSDTGFSSPVTINPRSQKERFSITAQSRALPQGGDE